MSILAIHPTVTTSHPRNTTAVEPARPAAPPAKTHPFQHGLPDLTQRQIAYRISRLARTFHLRAADAEDLRESLVIVVYGAMRRHDPSISKPTTFAKGIMDMWYLQTCRTLRKRCDLQRRHSSLPEPGAEGLAYVAQRADPAREAGLRLDLREALRNLPRELRVLAEELRTKSIPEIAAERRVHRATVLRMVQKIRGYLSNLDPAAA